MTRTLAEVRANWIKPDGTYEPAADVDRDVREDVHYLIAAIDRVRALHVKVENPRHGCCAPPQLCTGHAPECRASEHPIGGVPWPCSTLRAIDGLPAPDARQILTNQE